MKTLDNKDIWNNGFICGKFEMWTNGFCECRDMIESLNWDIDIKDIKEHLMTHSDMEHFWEDSYNEDQQKELIDVLVEFGIDIRDIVRRN